MIFGLTLEHPLVCNFPLLRILKNTYKRGLHSDTRLEVDHAGVVEPEHKLRLPHVVPDGWEGIFNGSFQPAKSYFTLGSNILGSL